MRSGTERIFLIRLAAAGALVVAVSSAALALSPAYITKERTFWFGHDALDLSPEDADEFERLLSWGKTCTPSPSVLITSGSTRDSTLAVTVQALRQRELKVAFRAADSGFRNIGSRIEPSTGDALREHPEDKPDYVRVIVVCY